MPNWRRRDSVFTVLRRGTYLFEPKQGTYSNEGHMIVHCTSWHQQTDGHWPEQQTGEVQYDNRYCIDPVPSANENPARLSNSLRLPAIRIYFSNISVSVLPSNRVHTVCAKQPGFRSSAATGPMQGQAYGAYFPASRTFALASLTMLGVAVYSRCDTHAPRGTMNAYGRAVRQWLAFLPRRRL